MKMSVTQNVPIVIINFLAIKNCFLHFYIIIFAFLICKSIFYIFLFISLQEIKLTLEGNVGESNPHSLIFEREIDVQFKPKMSLAHA